MEQRMLCFPRDADFVVLCNEHQAIYTKFETFRLQFDLRLTKTGLNQSCKQRFAAYTFHIPHLLRYVKSQTSEQLYWFITSPSPKDQRLRLIHDQLSILSSIDGAIAERYNGELLHLDVCKSIGNIIANSFIFDRPEYFAYVFYLDQMDALNQRVLDQRAAPLPSLVPYGPQRCTVDQLDITEWLPTFDEEEQIFLNESYLSVVSILETMVKDLADCDYSVAKIPSPTVIVQPSSATIAKNIYERHSQSDCSISRAESLNLSSVHDISDNIWQPKPSRLTSRFTEASASSVYLRAMAARRFGGGSSIRAQLPRRTDGIYRHVWPHVMTFMAITILVVVWQALVGFMTFLLQAHG